MKVETLGQSQGVEPSIVKKLIADQACELEWPSLAACLPQAADPEQLFTKMHTIIRFQLGRDHVEGS